MNFRVGQKVVCVDDRPYDPHRNPVCPYIQSGQVYTVRWVGEFPYAPDRSAGIGIRLEGVRRPEDPDTVFADYPFDARRFRPVVERQTDISTFTRMLDPDAIERAKREHVNT